MDHHVYVADSETGRQIWKSEKLGGAVIGSPTYDDQNKLLFAATVGNEMVALDIQTGKVEWRVPTEQWVWSAPLLVDSTLYFGDADGFFYSLSAANGAQNWKIQPLPGSSIIGQPILVGDTIYYTSESATVYGVNAAGTIARTFNVAAKLYTPPVWVGDKFLVAEMEGDALLIALNENGAQQWVYTPAK
jgi:outer membrane protein assembly factor BamB